MAAVGTHVSDESSSYFDVPGVAVVKWNQELKAVCVEMQGWANTGEAQTMLDAIILALRANHSSRWLLDGRKMKVIKQSDQDWITQNWLPARRRRG